MPKEYNNEMRFALFKNDKGDNDKRPDYRGTCQVAGVEYDLSAWIRTGREGAKFMSGQIQPKRDRQPSPGTEPNQPEPTDTPQDDVPF